MNCVINRCNNNQSKISNLKNNLEVNIGNSIFFHGIFNNIIVRCINKTRYNNNNCIP